MSPRRQQQLARLGSFVIAAASAAISFYGLVFHPAPSLLEPASHRTEQVGT
jgi:hypothetical protein